MNKPVLIDSFEMLRAITEIVTKQFYEQARISREFLRERSNLSTSLNCVDSSINLASFIDYFNRQKSNTKGGIRIYPSFDSGDRRMKLIAEDVVDGSIIPVNPYYYYLESSGYNTLPTAVPKSSVEPFFLNYFNEIRVNGNTQQSGNPLFKVARFYSWKDFENDLFEANEIDLTNSSAYSGYTLKIETGYVSEFLEQICILLYGKKVSHIGFTVLLSIYDHAGNQLEKIMEVGHPCPPQCGSLTW